jgi:hypothetical protein
MTRHPPRSRTPPARAGVHPPEQPGSRHEPAPVDLGCESVAGEEDPGASAEPPAAPRSDEAADPHTPDDSGASRS